MAVSRRARFRPRGVVLDRPPQFVPDEFWTACSNATFRHDVVERSGGYKSVWQDTNAFPTPPIQGAYAPFQGTGYWVMVGTDTVFSTDGATHTDITPTAGLVAVSYNDWVIDNLNGLAVFTNGVDTPFWWNGNPQFQCEPLPDFPAPGARTVRAYKNHLVAMNMTGVNNDDQVLFWSDAAAAGTIPQSWTPGELSDAGDNVLGDEIGPIIDGRTLRDDFIIYKRKATYIMTFVGGLVVMQFRKLFTEVGALNKNCIAEVGGFHYVLTDGDVIRHDGQNLESIADDVIRQTLFRFITPENFQTAYVQANAQEDEVWFFIPTQFGDDPTIPTIAAVYHIDGGFWSVRGVPTITGAASGIVTLDTTPADPTTWDDIVGSWQAQTEEWNAGSSTLGTVTDGMIWFGNGKAYFLDASVDGDGTTIAARLDRDSSSLGSPQSVKLVTKLWPDIRAVQGTEFKFRVSGQVELYDNPIGSEATFIVGQDKWVDCLVSGKYISVEISTNQDRLWEIVGYDLEYQEMSAY